MRKSRYYDCHNLAIRHVKRARSTVAIQPTIYAVFCFLITFYLIFFNGFSRIKNSIGAYYVFILCDIFLFLIRPKKNITLF